MGQNVSAKKENYAKICRGRVKNITIFTLIIVIIFLSKCEEDNEVVTISEPITIIETETLIDTIETVKIKTLWKTNTKIHI